MTRSDAPQPRTAGLPSARVIAARVVERALRDAAFATPTLDAELSRYPQLEPRERALATELTYGVLRARTALIAELSKYAKRGLEHDLLVLSHLLVAAYQVLLLDRIPAFAAVDSAVTALSKTRGPKIAGFGNAVLRKLVASGVRLDPAAVAEQALPAWLLERLRAAVGPSEARHLYTGPATTAVRLIEGRPVPEWLEPSERGQVAPTARRVQAEGDWRARPGFSEGCFIVQEEGAQCIALALGARPGERVLDACAGRGQKTSLLSERVGAAGEVWAVDLHPNKLDKLVAEHERLGLPAPRVAAVDWTVGSGPVPTDFDRVLVDAPCTGTGTLRRRPEIALRLTPEDPARLGDVQRAILRRVALHVRPGGRLVYAVCSVLMEEAEEVVGSVLDLLEPAPFDAPELANLVTPEQTAFRLLPGQHGTDGYYVASFRRR